MEVLNATPSSGSSSLKAELAMAFPPTTTTSPHPCSGTGILPTSRNYSLLWSLAPYAEQLHEKPWELSLMGERQEQNNRAPVAGGSFLSSPSPHCSEGGHGGER